MRTALVFVLLAACGIQNKVAPDGAAGDGAGGAGDTGGSGSGGVLSIELTDKPASLGNQASVSFGWNVTAGATVECRVDSDAYVACTSPHPVASLGEGAHSFDARATLGDQMAEVPKYTFTVDTIAPALVITGQPPALSPVATAQFHFMTDDATTVTCQLDAAAAAPCTDSVSYSSLADGAHTFTLTGSDGAGNTATKTYTWTVDTSAPSLTITMEPPNPTNTTSARFEFTIGTSSTVLCQLDSGAANGCTSPQTYSGLAQGNHTFTLRGTNATGQTTTQTYTWDVDTTPPVVSIDSQPAANSPAAAGQFAFTVSGASTVVCALDGGTPATCSLTFPYSLPDGSHTFTLKATDLAGNVTTKTATWTIDTVAPTITLGSTPPNPSTSAAAQFAFTVTGATTTTCKLDSGSATSCTTSASYSGLADGNHTFTITATDAATNSTTKTYTWLIDTVPPILQITSAPSGSVNTSTAHFGFTSGNDAVSVTCQLDSATAQSCIASIDYTGVADGSHTFTLRATDAAGNTATRTATWTVDTVPPAVTITSHPNDPSTSANATFQFTVTGATSTTCQLDSGAAAACSAATSYSGLADGTHAFHVSASDAAGNTTDQYFSWTIDTTPPSITWGTGLPRNPTNVTSATFSFTVTGATTTTCQLDTGTPNNCTNTFSTTGLSEQPHVFTVRASDAAGNQASLTYNWTVDVTAPYVKVTNTPPSNSHSVSVNFTVSDGSPVCSLNLAPSTACSSPWTATLADGSYNLTVLSTDAAGNTGADGVSWVIDTTLPSVSISGTCDASSITWTWSSSDANGVKSCTCTPLGEAAFDCTNAGTATWVNLAQKSFSMTCTDNYGNVRTSSKSINTSLCQ